VRRKKKKKTGARAEAELPTAQRAAQQREPTNASPLAFRRWSTLYKTMPGCLAHGLDPGEGSSIVSILPIRAALLPLLGTREACSLRGVCRELKQAVGDFPWEDMDTVIRGDVALWRACFPRALGANVGQRGQWGENPNGRLTAVVDADFVLLGGLKALNMSWCRQVTDAAFVHLRGIERLYMS
jgi:hypothetical protein